MRSVTQGVTPVVALSDRRSVQRGKVVPVVDSVVNLHKFRCHKGLHQLGGVEGPAGDVGHLLDVGDFAARVVERVEPRKDARAHLAAASRPEARPVRPREEALEMEPLVVRPKGAADACYAHGPPPPNPTRFRSPDEVAACVSRAQESGADSEGAGWRLMLTEASIPIRGVTR